MGESDLKVLITTGESSCSECGGNLGRRAWITLVEGKGALCLACADLDHLVFLPAGDATLTHREQALHPLCGRSALEPSKEAVRAAGSVGRGGGVGAGRRGSA